MPLYATVKIFIQKRTIIGMGTLLDDLFGAFPWPFAPQVGYTKFRHHNLHRMLIVIFMRHFGHDAAYSTILGGRRSKENRKVRVAGKITLPTDPVHHMGTIHMGGVHAAEDIHFDGGIQGDDTESTRHPRIIGDLRRA